MNPLSIGCAGDRRERWGRPTSDGERCVRDLLSLASCGRKAMKFARMGHRGSTQGFPFTPSCGFVGWILAGEFGAGFLSTAISRSSTEPRLELETSDRLGACYPGEKARRLDAFIAAPLLFPLCLHRCKRNRVCHPGLPPCCGRHRRRTGNGSVWRRFGSSGQIL